MALDHDGFNFFNHNHGPIQPVSAAEPQLAVRRVFGVKGEFHIRGDRGGRDIVCRMTLDNYNTVTLLQNNLDILQQKALTLTGDLKEQLTNGGIVIFKDCTFLGADPLGEVFLDGSGQWGWVQRVLLRWRQRSPNS